jgi:regulator of nucleoside diphosphate kinase
MRPFTHEIVLTKFDHRRLKGMLQVLRRRSGVDPWNLNALEVELGRARIVPPESVPPTVVTMNSRVRLRDLDSGDQIAVSLVFPAARASNASSVPVLSPLGLALLGCCEGDLMEWPTQEGARRLRVESVIYQPEAQGDFFI